MQNVTLGRQIVAMSLLTYSLWDCPVIDFMRRCTSMRGCVDYQETIVSVDPSGRGTDETVAVVLSQANGYVFVRDMRAYRDGYSDETLSDIVRQGRSMELVAF